MRADEHKKLCNQPNAFSRHDLQITEKSLREANAVAASRLAELLRKLPVPKSEKHKGDVFSDYFLIALPESGAELIIDFFTNLEAGHLENDGTTTRAASFHAVTADEWRKYLSSVETES
jgi:hypothetical protein